MKICEILELIAFLQRKKLKKILHKSEINTKDIKNINFCAFVTIQNSFCKRNWKIALYMQVVPIELEW